MELVYPARWGNTLPRQDGFVMGVGTGGCFSGNAEVYKREVPGVRCIALERGWKDDRPRRLAGQRW